MTPGLAIAEALRNYRAMWPVPDEHSPSYNLHRMCDAFEFTIRDEPRPTIRLALVHQWAATMLLIESLRT